MKFYVSVATAFMLASPAVSQDAVSHAYNLCALLDGTGMTSEKCSVSGRNSSVTTTIDMSASEARKLCSQISEHVSREGWNLDGWTLNIKSPYSGENNIAFCRLR